MFSVVLNLDYTSEWYKPESLVKTQIPGLLPQSFWISRFTFLTIFQVLLMLLAQGPHLENHLFIENT